MPITSRDFQPTLEGPPAGGEHGPAPAASRPRARVGAATPPTVAPIPGSVGIVFVHGIGSQGPSETFLDWSRPIVEMLRAWRASEGHPGDPVIRSRFSFSAAGPPLLDLAIPAAAGLPEGRWLVTEAWWAADLRAPSLGTVTAYLRSRLGRVIAGIAAGYRSREETWRERRALGGGDRPGRWAWIDTLDRLQARAFSLGLLVAPLTVIGSVVLAGYALLRKIPIGAVRDFAELRIVDSFLVDWFGDLPVLLGDSVQVANVRARVADAIDRLRAEGADAIVLVGHSGGALVSFETLLDPAYLDRPVDKLVTLGQGLSLGWRLESDPVAGAPPPGDRLLGDLATVRPNLRWVDVWASYDPAPAGPLRPIAGVPLDVVDAPEAQVAWSAPSRVPTPLVVESRPVTNRMNVLEDHGAYWDNDEGFLVPLVRHLDAPRGPATESRFYRDPDLRADRIERRRERVAVLAAWDWLCALAAAVAIVVLVVAALAARGNALADTGASAAGLVGIIPGHELVTGPVSTFGLVVGNVAATAGATPLAEWIGRGGPLALGGILVVLLFLALAAGGNARWDTWDERERHAARAETPVFPSRRGAAAEAIALLGGLAALVLATAGAAFGVGWLPVAVAAVASCGVGLIVSLTASDGDA
ncbi:MAG TPA: hypothetical protein VFI28_06170 [Candidatus Limnocylindrales bacterium]|nr:hypothetical protein [Candidatus Limnocylindrales bacterium]